MKLIPLWLAFSVLAAPSFSIAAADEAGFQPLFNGTNTAGWHLRNPQGLNSWSVEDGILKNTVGGDVHGTDLVTDQKFWNFTVRFDYLVPKDSNSGFYLRGRHELQILGDAASGKASLTGNGAIYNFKAPDHFVSKPGDEWQTVEATIIDDKITVVHNGLKTHDNVVCRVATGSELDRQVDEPGSIFLQGNHGTVWFRRIEIRELK